MLKLSEISFVTAVKTNFTCFFKIIALYICVEFKKYGNLSGQIHVHAVPKLACIIVGLALSCSIVSFEFNKKLY